MNEHQWLAGRRKQQAKLQNETPDQKRANDFCGRLSGTGNRADKLLDDVTGSDLPQRETEKKRGEESLGQKVPRVRGPQQGHKKT